MARAGAASVADRGRRRQPRVPARRRQGYRDHRPRRGRAAMSTRFAIARLGSQGDGVAETETGEVFIPFTLPGETVTAAREKDRATLMAVLEASPLRVDPPCRHFGECGGCAVQH